MILSPPQIATVAATAGFAGDDLVIAVAVCLAESRGKTDAYDPEPLWFQQHPNIAYTGDNGSVGLWQIFRAVHPEHSFQDLLDPAVNASAAFDLYSARRGSFKDWSTFNSGEYQRYMAAAQSAVDSLQGQAQAQVISSTPGVTILPPAPPTPSLPDLQPSSGSFDLSDPLVVLLVFVVGAFFFTDVFD